MQNRLHKILSIPKRVTNTNIVYNDKIQLLEQRRPIENFKRLFAEKVEPLLEEIGHVGNDRILTTLATNWRIETLYDIKSLLVALRYVLDGLLKDRKYVNTLYPDDAMAIPGYFNELYAQLHILEMGVDHLFTDKYSILKG